MKVNIVRITDNPTELIYKAYRLCYSKGNWDSIDTKSTQDMIDFIKPLMSNNHTSPLEHAAVTFSIEGLSRSAHTQLIRHRTGKFNVQSQRYVDGSNFEYVVPTDIYKNEEAADIFNNHMSYTWEKYDELVDILSNQYIIYGMSKFEARKKAYENARALLPNACTCNLVVTFDLNNFRKFLSLRLCSHAQDEIRELATVMLKQVKEHVDFIDYKVMGCGRTCNECMK